MVILFMYVTRFIRTWFTSGEYDNYDQFYFVDSVHTSLKNVHQSLKETD